ncbi:DNA repair protein RecN [Alteromonas lipolytica]|uniref:DNA repair protein RecN n=1 Tax=Alteromonas lipolytica TaxID=1856405 RepID=A0A1E8FEH9_9ALTE|nr:DNA repair protein RecN [Alteromonas lipolytica]OFI34332.1 DNA repair protein RecN [Alteromonas lipolytica]GGF82396.1 DNA repair protein RecN [Alteromonas lipolytica]
MLSHLSVKNFAVVKEINIAFEAGMTAVTGETGAGKSIAIDALSLCLGERADASAVRKGADKAEIIAYFSLLDAPLARNWLDENEMVLDDDPNTCFIRRLISKEGRSKAFINGVPVALQQLKQLGQFLLAIHGQNTHLQLLKDDVQRKLLDDYAEHAGLLKHIEQSYKLWQTLAKELVTLEQAAQQRADREQLLSYQVTELDDFALAEGEFAELEAEHKRLSNGQTLLEEAQKSFYHLYEADEFNALSAIQTSIDKLSGLEEHDPALTPIVAMLNEAAIQVEESAHELRSYCDQLEIDPLRLQQVEKRYAQAMEFARKHQVMPEELCQHHQQLAAELAGLSADTERLTALSEELEQAHGDYLTASEKLSKSRSLAAVKLAEQVQTQIRTLNMPHAEFTIEVSYNQQARPTSMGMDTVSMKVSTNPGQPQDRLDKVVSGGELSRIGLALQVISRDTSLTPTMIFDEVDTGISGPTASIVGQLLRRLGKENQVMCVTHLPQVAAQAHNQLFVTKTTESNETQTHILALTEQARIDELARLLAGDKITPNALANAKELLDNATAN